MAKMTLEKMDNILAKHEGVKPIIFVETGTYQGKTCTMMKARFQTVWTVELSPELFASTSKQFANSGVVFHQGDSVEFLTRVVTHFKRPVVWYLDAHYFRPGPSATWRDQIAKCDLPLFKELALVATRPQADIVIVDDVHAFGLHRLGWDDVNPASIREALGIEREAQAYVQSDQFVVHRKAAV